MANAEASRRWREKNLERHRQMNRDQMRGKPNHTTNAMRNAWKKRNPEKVESHRIFKAAVSRGQLIRPARCEECGRDPGVNKAGTTLIQGHHEDYSRPLDVTWLCVDCHRARHRASVILARM